MKKWLILVGLLVATVIYITSRDTSLPEQPKNKVEIKVTEKEKGFIKWAEFDVTKEMLDKAYVYDVESKGEKNWIDLLAYAVSKNWGNVDKRCLAYIDEAALIDFQNFQKPEYFDYYKEVYSTVLGGFIKNNDEYGLCVYSPVAENFSFTHYKDFGQIRNYGYRRTHMGNDLLGTVGTPMICVESGIVEVIGWNRYGGWRIGIRSLDKKRYYYYAHLRKDHPYNKNIKVGDKIDSGDVIGYLGMTGYSEKENVNNIEVPHLHFGIQLIFDETQKDGENQIWIDVYDLIEFLEKNKSEVEYDEEKKEYVRVGSKY